MEEEALAYVVPAKAMAVVDLVADDACVARGILSELKPQLTKPQYLAYLRSFSNLLLARDDRDRDAGLLSGRTILAIAGYNR